MIADMRNNTKLNSTVAELYITRRKLNISLVFITQTYFAVSKSIRLNFMHYSVTETPNKWEFHQIAFNYLSGIDFGDFMNFFEKVLKIHFLF